MAARKDKDSYKNLSPSELARIEERFKRRRLAAAESGNSEAAALHRKFRRKVIIYSVVGVLLLGYVLNLLDTRKPTVAPPPLQGPAAAVLGEHARLSTGLKEVADAHYAWLEGLAEGSEAAQHSQRVALEWSKMPLEVENSIGMRFRYIPAGSFTMGSPETEAGRSPDETSHSSTMRVPYYMGKYEVTQAEWNAVMGAASNPSGFHDSYRQPVETVSWRQALDFCRKLSEREGLPRGSYRLPTEPEWEYACRAGTETPFHFEGGAEKLGNYADFELNNYHYTSLVGQRLPNAWGLYDMHGNVWEWCSNHFYDYVTGEKDMRYRSLRGGNWRMPATDCRSASRFRYTETSSAFVLGFRVLRVIDPALLEASGESPVAPDDDPEAHEASEAPDAVDVPPATPATPGPAKLSPPPTSLEPPPATPVP